MIPIASAMRMRAPNWLLLTLAAVGLELVILALLPLDVCSACDGTGAWKADAEFAGQCSGGCGGTGRRSLARKWFGHEGDGPAPKPAPPPTSLADLIDAPLPRTEVVPAFTSTLPQGKNAVWCAAFQLAWDELKTGVVGEPIVLGPGADTLANRLNSGAFPKDALREESYVAVAGRAGDGVVEKIRREMGRRFADFEPALDDVQGSSIVAYAYLRASVSFHIPFFESRSALAFRDGRGNTRPVRSFGIRREDDYAYDNLRAQVDVLYAGSGVDSPGSGAAELAGNVPEFALDLDRGSDPYQVIVAKVARKPSLSETWAYVEAKILGYPGRGADGIGCNEVVLIPNITLSTTRRFRELEGEGGVLRNSKMKGLRISSAIQSIQFVLNRSGAELGSEAKMIVLPIPRYFIIDGPFLVVLRKRGERQPFFALWVEDPEVLEGWN